MIGTTVAILAVFAVVAFLVIGVPEICAHWFGWYD